MRILENPRYEAFAQASAKRALLIDAYVSAGFVRHRGHPSRLAWKADACRIDKDFKDVGACDFKDEPPEGKPERPKAAVKPPGESPAAAPSAPRGLPMTAPRVPRHRLASAARAPLVLPGLSAAAAAPRRAVRLPAAAVLAAGARLS